MKVSIIIPVDDATGLAASLQGVRAQRYDAGEVEIIVVVYGDCPKAVVVPTLDRVRSFVVEHASPYVARNRGAAEADGDWENDGSVDEVDGLEGVAVDDLGVVDLEERLAIMEIDGENEVSIDLDAARLKSHENGSFDPVRDMPEFLRRGRGT